MARDMVPWFQSVTELAEVRSIDYTGWPPVQSFFVQDSSRAADSNLVAGGVK